MSLSGFLADSQAVVRNDLKLWPEKSLVHRAKTCASNEGRRYGPPHHLFAVLWLDRRPTHD
jgi:hypothetical protein